ncbi:MAG TPA: TadE family type IV pilus minor pilin [Pseudonocardiaceae bacterium]
MAGPARPLRVLHRCRALLRPVAGDRGATTVETAIAVCVITLVTAIGLVGFVAAHGQVRCVDAAREAARLTARGEQGRATEVATSVAPAGATVSITVTGDEVVVRVDWRPASELVPGLRIGSEAVAVLEPGVTG